MDAKFSPVELLYDLTQASPELDAQIDAWSEGKGVLPPAVEELVVQAYAQLEREPFALREVLYLRRIEKLSKALHAAQDELAEADNELLKAKMYLAAIARGEDIRELAAADPARSQHDPATSEPARAEPNSECAAAPAAPVGSGSPEHELASGANEPGDPIATGVPDRSTPSATQGKVVFGQARTYGLDSPSAEHDARCLKRDPGDTPRLTVADRSQQPAGRRSSLDSPSAEHDARCLKRDPGDTPRLTGADRSQQPASRRVSRRVTSEHHESRSPPDTNGPLQLTAAGICERAPPC